MDRKIKLLMVDDEEDFLFFLKINLEKTGRFEIITSNRGTEAIPLAKRHLPDVIILDIVMPDMHGPEIAEGLLESRSTRSIPIIFLTALAKESEIHADDTIGGRYFMAKPVNLRDLTNRIDYILTMHAKKP